MWVVRSRDKTPSLLRDLQLSDGELKGLDRATQETPLLYWVKRILMDHARMRKSF